MKKLSKILESIWSDMQDRGTGDAIKKEEDFTKDEKDSLVRLYLMGYIKSCVYTYKNPYNFSLEMFELYFDDYWERDHRFSYQLDGEDKETKKKKDWSYFTRNWDKGDDLQKKVEDKINEYEERISKMGLKRKPSYNLIDTLNYWWRSLDDNQKKHSFSRASEFVHTLDQDEWDELDEWDKHKLDLKWSSFSYDTKLYVYDSYTNWPDEIDESIWSDMQDRGTEDSIKKEDDTFAHFAGELKKKYEFKRLDDIETGDDYITIPMFKYITYYSNLEMQRIVSGKKIIVFSYRNLAGTGLAKNKQDAYDDLLKALDERFDTKTELTIQDRWFEKYIRPKDGGEIDNKFFIEVLDFIIDTLDKLPTRYERIVYKLVKESIWSDMQERGTGDAVKKEDDVNHMNFDTFADYIKNNYSEKGDWFSVDESADGKSRHIVIDIISGMDLSFNVVDGKVYNILINNYGYNYVDVPGLKKIFNVNLLGRSTFSVVEKDWTKSNNTFVKLIEFFLGKKTNESIWSDMQDRGTGDVVKKEDDIENLDRDGLQELIVDKYELKPKYNSALILSRQTSPENEYIKYISLPVFASGGTLYIYRMSIIFKDKTIKSIYIQLSDTLCRQWCPSLFDKFLIAENGIGNGIFIYSKENKQVTNRLCMDVIETIVNDSERSALQKREN